MPLSLGNIILKEKGRKRESIPRQVDKKSRIPEKEKGTWGSRRGDRGLEFSRRRKGQAFSRVGQILRKTKGQETKETQTLPGVGFRT